MSHAFHFTSFNQVSLARHGYSQPGQHCMMPALAVAFGATVHCAAELSLHVCAYNLELKPQRSYLKTHTSKLTPQSVHLNTHTPRLMRRSSHLRTRTSKADASRLQTQATLRQLVLQGYVECLAKCLSELRCQHDSALASRTHCLVHKAMRLRGQYVRALGRRTAKDDEA